MVLTMHIAERLGCDDRVFLLDVVTAYETDGHEIGSATTLAVQGLKSALSEMRLSDDPYVRDKLDDIDANFMDRDDMAYCDEQPQGLMVGRRLTKRLQRANRQQIVDFGLWYQARVRQLGDQLAEDQPLLAEDAITRTDGLVDQGIFPKSARDLMRKSTVWAGTFEPIGSVEQEANNHDGYCYEDGIGISNLYMAPVFPAVIGLQMKQTTFHEYLHGIGHLGTNRRGLFFGLTGRLHSNYNRWLEEGYVAMASYEAVKQAARPSALSLVSQPYPAERQFLNLAMHAAPQPVDLSDISAAHFSGRHPTAKARLYVAQNLSSGLNDIFPEYQNDAWQEINKAYEAKARRQDRQAYISDLLLKASTRTSFIDDISHVA